MHDASSIIATMNNKTIIKCTFWKFWTHIRSWTRQWVPERLLAFQNMQWPARELCSYRHGILIDSHYFPQSRIRILSSKLKYCPRYVLYGWWMWHDKTAQYFFNICFGSLTSVSVQKHTIICWFCWAMKLL